MYLKYTSSVGNEVKIYLNPNIICHQSMSDDLVAIYFHTTLVDKKIANYKWSWQAHPSQIHNLAELKTFLDTVSKGNAYQLYQAQIKNEKPVKETKLKKQKPPDTQSKIDF